MKDWEALEPDKYVLMNKHYTPGRNKDIDRVVIHHNAGVNLTTDDCWNLWQTREASAHYQVEPDGVIGQLVNDWDTAWHAADIDINNRSIGIEHANTGGPDDDWPISEATRDQGAKLVAALCKAYGLGRPAWGVNVFGHSQFASTGCPYHLAPGGKYHADYMARAARYYDDMTGASPAKEIDTMTDDQLRRITEKLDTIIAQGNFISAQLAGDGGAGGWPQGGGRTLYDLAAAIAEIEGVPNTRDTVA